MMMATGTAPAGFNTNLGIFLAKGTKDDDATYSGYIFTEQAVTAIHAHHNTTPDHPLFMYLGQCFSKRVFS